MVGSDAGDRTLPPTERRRREARLAGDVVRSAELTSALTLLAASCAFWWLAPGLAEAMASLLRVALTTGPRTSLSIDSVMDLIQQSCSKAIWVLVLPAIFVLLVAILGNGLQTGWILNRSLIVPRFRLQSPLSMNRTAETVGLCLKSVLIFVASGIFIVRNQSQWFMVGREEPVTIIVQSATLMGTLMLQLSTCLLVCGLLDYACRFWSREQRLKMTVAERRREQQEEQVDPAIRQRRATMQRPSSQGKSPATSGVMRSVGTVRR